MRRVVWTKNLLACSQIGQDTVIDAIPLYEVTSVQSVQDHEDVANQGDQATNREEESLNHVVCRKMREFLSWKEDSALLETVSSGDNQGMNANYVC